MEPIQIDEAQKSLDRLMHKDVYVHVETTNGAYASHVNEKAYNVGVYVRNATVRFSQAKIVAGEDSYRIGLKLEKGWNYADDLKDWKIDESEKFLFDGNDSEGRLMVALHISETLFDY